MKLTKKLLAVLLCLAMLPLTLLSVFADGASQPTNPILFSATFGEGGDGAAKIENARKNENTKIEYANEYLVIGHADGKAATSWRALETVTDTVMAQKSYYSVQTTFRWKSGATGNETVIFGTYACDYGLKYNGKIQNFGANNADVSDTSAVGQRLSGAWAVPEGEDYGPWVTATLEIENNKPARYTVTVGSFVETVEYKGSINNVKTHKKDGTSATPDMAIYTGGNSAAFEISALVVEELPAPTSDRAGEVLYSVTFDGSDDSKQKIKNWDTLKHKLEIQNNGLLRISPVSGWNKIELSKDVLGAEKTYTVQLTFRYLSNSEKQGGISFGVSSTGDPNVGWRYLEHHKTPGKSSLSWYNGSQNPGQELPEALVNEWKAPEDAVSQFTGVPSTSGNWVTATVEIENGALGKFSFDCNGVHREYDNACAKAQTGEFAGGKLFLYMNNVGVEIYDYRVVAGTGLDLTPPTVPALSVEGSSSLGNNTAGNRVEANDDKKSETAEADATEEVAEEKRGCGSFVAATAVPMLVAALVSGAAIATKRRKEN